MENSHMKKAASVLWPYLVIVLATLVMIAPQLRTGATLIGGDTFFHYGRFYDTAMQWKTGNFSYFQTNFGFQQSGRVINAVYGPLFAYLNGLLVLLSGSWHHYQILSDFIICLLGAGSMFYLLRKVKINKVLALIFSLIYINIGMIPAYVNGSSFNGWGQAIMPFVLLCGVRMITDSEKPINWIELMLVMSILAQIHVLSTLMAALLLIPFFIISLVKNHNSRKVWLPFFKAVLGSIVLSLNLAASFIILMSKNHVATPDAYNMMFNGLRLSLYHAGFGGSLGTSYAMVLPIFALAAILQLLHVLFHFKQNQVNTVVTIWSFILLAIASIYFPWGFVQNHLPFLKTSFQFPFRLIVIAYPMMILGLALTMQQLLKSSRSWGKIGSWAAVLVLLFEAIVPTVVTNKSYTVNHVLNQKVQAASHSHDLQKFLDSHEYAILPDYLPLNVASQGQDFGINYQKNVVKTAHQYQHSVQGATLKLSWNAKQTKQVMLPIIAYAQSRVTVNGKNFTGKKSEIGNPIVSQKKGKNVATMQFISPLWFKVLNTICLLIWVCGLLWLCWSKFMVDYRSKTK